MTFDRLLALLLLPLVAPIAALVAVAVYIDSPGPVLYRARRVGQRHREFDMLKFRTMIRDASGPAISAHGDTRYTPLGRFLSRSRLDELPQLWNVVRGDMRFVGPRPEARRFVEAFPSEYAEILEVPPGLTGPTQVAYAWEGEALAAAEEHDRERLYRDTILPLKVLLDLEYVRDDRRGRDLVVLARTAVLPLRQLGLASGLAAGAHGRRRPRLGQLAALLMTAAFVSLFLVDAAEAQDSGVTVVQPTAGSPAGTQYAVPTESGRDQAAPAPQARVRARRGTAPITTNQRYGSSTEVPGPAARRSSGAERDSRPRRRRQDPQRAGRRANRSRRSARTPTQRSGPVVQAASPVGAADDASLMRSWFLVALAIGAGLGVATVARRAAGDA